MEKTSDRTVEVEKERKRSKSLDSRSGSVSSEAGNETKVRAKDAEDTQRISKAIEEEDAFLEYIKSLPAMSTDRVEAYNKQMQTPVYKRSTSEVVGGLEHLDNLYKLMEHLGQLRKQNFQLQKRLKHLENINQEEEKVEEDTKRLSRFKRSTKCKSSHYGFRHSLMRSQRERSRSVGVEEITANVYRPLEYEPRSKAKVSKWTKVKEAFRWEKASCAVLPEAKSQDSGIGAGEDLRFLRVPQSSSDHSSFSVSPADSVLSEEQSLTPRSGLDTMPQMTPSTSDEEDEIELDYSADSRKGSGSREGIEASRRSKSLDGDPNIATSDLLQHHLSQKDRKHLHKGHKTPWGKVKDIIQTRTGSIKKRREEESEAGYEVRSETSENLHPDEVLDDELLSHLSSSACALPGEATDGQPLKIIDNVSKRRLAPMLTITLPSTEELRSAEGEENPSVHKVSSKPPLSPPTEDRVAKTSGKLQYNDDEAGPQKEIIRRQPSSGGNVGTSPPSIRNQSKWSKVKHVFLTTASNAETCPVRQSSSVPSSPVKATSFLYDMEYDELSSGDFVDENTRDDDVFQENVYDLGEGEAGDENIRAEIQRNFEELQLKLSNEFTKKLNEWDKIKNSGIGTPPTGPRLGGTGSGISSGTSSVGDDTPQDKEFRRKMEEWEKLRNPAVSSAKHRESITLQQLGEEYLSPDFKKKLEQWEKIKSIPIPQTPDTFNSSQPQLKKKITEWQRWRPGGKSDAHVTSPELPEDFHRKLQEWERLKQSSIAGMVPDDGADNKSPSPGSSRREFPEKTKSQHSPTGKKWGEGSGVLVKVHKGKGHHEVKELAWLEKELHKIEREKQRLEREREKYLEREARLETMRRAIDSSAQSKEILIPTSTGFFRFQGISQKFTRKLYEWEKARGIGPEASTFALLDPGYQPPTKCQATSQKSGDMGGNGALLTRSKSVGSVVDVGACGNNQSGLAHQHSSMSLNNMEELDANQLDSVLRGSDGDLCCEHMSDNCGCDREPEAVIVDVEDVIEETASPLADTPQVEQQTPVYCYAPEEVTRLIDSSGSDSDKDLRGEAVQSSYQLLEENITLLDKLRKKEDICRELECEMENLEGRLQVTAMIHKEQLGSLAEVSERPSEHTEHVVHGDESVHLEKIKARLQELECHQELLLRKGETLQYTFAEHSEQQAVLAQHLVGNVKQLQEASISIAADGNERAEVTTSGYNDQREEALSMVQDLTLELLNMAEKLEIAVGERNREILRLKKALGGRGRAPMVNNLRSSQHWFSTDSMAGLGIAENEDSFLPRQTSEELTQLPSMLTYKVLELKRGLSYLCAASDLPSGHHHEYSNIPEAPTSPEAETSFVFKVAKKNESPNIVEVTSPERRENAGDAGEGNTSPEVSFTFTPAFFRRKSTECEKESENALNFINEESRVCKDGEGCEESRKECDGREDVTKDAARRVRRRKDSGDRSNIGKWRSRQSEDEDDEGRQFETNVTKKATSKSKKLLKTRRITDTQVSYENSHQDNTASGDEEAEVNEERRASKRRPKRLSRNNSREEAVKEHADAVVEDCAEMTVNVFVPTTRKIFSPVRRDSKGKASSVISYVVEQESEASEKREDVQKEMEKEKKVEEKEVREESNFIMPPCWILKQVTRAQSASPAMQRRNFNKESEKVEKSSVVVGERSQNGGLDETQFKSSEPKIEEEIVEKSVTPNDVQRVDVEEAGSVSNPMKIEDPAEKEQAVRKDSLNSSIKLRHDVGFPPISPLSVRRDFKAQPKETSSNIRMMIARYNQKLSGSQEGSGTKSPESGSASPIAWRSPVAERRVKVQMEKYEDEVRRALQRSNRTDMRGSVQKSASAGYIRSFDKLFSSDSKRFNRRPSYSVEDKGDRQTRGILKSSSAGTIKTTSPLPQRSEKVHESSRDVSDKLGGEECKPEVKSTPLVKDDSGSSIYSESQSTKVRAMMLRKAKEEFLSRGPGGEGWDKQCATPEIEVTRPVARSLREQWKGSKNRLSQVSCGSESSYEGSPVILVRGQDLRDIDGTLLIKSASAGMIYVDPGTSKRIFNGASVQVEQTEQGTVPKSRLGIFSRFRKARMRRKDKEAGKLDAVSTLCRQSLVVDIHRKRGKEEGEPSTSKSCPSSPVLPKRDHSSWIRNPRKIFRPK